MKKKSIIALSGALLGFFAVSFASASEVTGTLTTGVQTGVQGIVISAPIASPAAGTYIGTQSVTLSSSGSQSIRYTTDGTVPTCTTGIVYSGALSVASAQTVQAIACYPNSISSSVLSSAYVINTTVTTGGGGGGGGGGGSSISCISGYTLVNGACVIVATTTTNVAKVTAVSSGTAVVNVVATTTTKGKVLGATAFMFKKDLGLGSKGDDVKELQKFLISQKLLNSTATGNFGALTRTALIKFQARNKLPPTGYFGPATRAFLNKKNS